MRDYCRNGHDAVDFAKSLHKPINLGTRMQCNKPQNSAIIYMSEKDLAWWCSITSCGMLQVFVRLKKLKIFWTEWKVGELPEKPASGVCACLLWLYFCLVRNTPVLHFLWEWLVALRCPHDTHILLHFYDLLLLTQRLSHSRCLVSCTGNVYHM